MNQEIPQVLPEESLHTHANRAYKDTLFRFLFGEKKRSLFLVSLMNA